MTAALNWCLSRPRIGAWPYSPPFVLSVGFSGALRPEQRVGDLVLATEVVDEQGHRWPALHTFVPNGQRMILGRVLMVSHLVSDPQAKQRLGQQLDAVAVDMESAAAARVCYERNVPFACLRVISDDQNTVLSPHLVGLLRRGRVSMPRLAGKVLRHPSLIRELLQLAANTRKGAKQLLAVRSLLEWYRFRERDSNTNPAPGSRPLISGL